MGGWMSLGVLLVHRMSDLSYVEHVHVVESMCTVFAIPGLWCLEAMSVGFLR